MVYGFPERIEQLLEFERKVSTPHIERILPIGVGPKTKLHNTIKLLYERKPLELGDLRTTL